MGGGLLQELDHLLVFEVVRKVELDGVVDRSHAWGVDGDGEEVPPLLHQLLRDHVSKVCLVPHEEQPHVIDPAQRLGREGDWVLHGLESPVDKTSGVGQVAEELDGERPWAVASRGRY